jgi:hypothetical protein
MNGKLPGLLNHIDTISSNHGAAKVKSFAKNFVHDITATADAQAAMAEMVEIHQ